MHTKTLVFLRDFVPFVAPSLLCFCASVFKFLTTVREDG